MSRIDLDGLLLCIIGYSRVCITETRLSGGVELHVSRGDSTAETAPIWRMRWPSNGVYATPDYLIIEPRIIQVTRIC